MASRSAVLSALVLPAGALKFSSVQSAADPIEKVVTLLTELKAGVEADGVSEQASYDKFACWCEDTLGKKAEDITKAKDDIEALRTEMIKFKGEIAAHAVEIKQLGKDITANEESQKEATELRKKEKKAYEEENAESLQCLGALTAAIDVLKGAGQGKKGFLETMHEAQLLSVVAGVRGILHEPVVSKSVAAKDLEVVQRFVERPDDFMGKDAGLSAAQVGKNPYGDYAPRSTQISGILKQMFDTFTEDMKKATEEEKEKVTSFEALMETKGKELDTLKATLQSHTSDKATKSKTLADDKVELDDTLKQLEADEVFFGETKGTCKDKAAEWSERTHLRTLELNGIAEAIEILSSDEAKATFKNASSTPGKSTFFLQVSSPKQAAKVNAAFGQLKALAGQYHSLEIARVAMSLKAGGHFDKIMVVIDKMIAHLREEEQQDIEERDWCEARENKNKNDMEDLNSAITKAENEIKTLEAKETELGTKVDDLEKDINATQTNLDDLKKMRNEEYEAFVQGVKDDTQAVELLEKAIASLAKTYGGKKAALVQQPDTNWSGKYNKRDGEGKGVVAILTMLKEDFEQEIGKARKDDAGAQKTYESDRGALTDTLKAQTASKTQVEKEKADVGMKIADTEEHKGQKNDDLTSETDKKGALETKCAWVASHFATRREKRQKEMQGLEDAKNYLAGVDSDSDAGAGPSG